MSGEILCNLIQHQCCFKNNYKKILHLKVDDRREWLCIPSSPPVVLRSVLCVFAVQKNGKKIERVYIQDHVLLQFPCLIIFFKVYHITQFIFRIFIRIMQKCLNFLFLLFFKVFLDRNVNSPFSNI